ncbi:MAG: SAM-dependent methyltransferase [Bacteroidota bacterium]
MSKGKLFLIPTYLSETNDRYFLSPMVLEIIKHCNYFFVENIRTARRFISSLNLQIRIEKLHFHQLNKKRAWEDLYDSFNPVRSGQDMAIISEAGLPCLADPGDLAVALAHQTGIRVVPLPGASSIQMALIASGFNGQQFSFHGYLPIDEYARTRKIKELERLSTTGYTQLFMETPYRNHQLLKDITRNCRPDTLLSVSSDISGENEQIITLPIHKWKITEIQIHKIPSIFSFGQFS